MLPTDRSFPPWGKAERGGDGRHHLAHHCADVAACFEAIVDQSVVRARLERTAAAALSPKALSRLTALAFLHDVGKLHPGFQAKAWPANVWRGPLRGHVQAGADLLLGYLPPAMGHAIGITAIDSWMTTSNILIAVLAHHGRPFKITERSREGWETVSLREFRYDPLSAAAEYGQILEKWFAPAFSAGDEPLPDRPRFHHLFSGLVALADWLGSDTRFFPFRAEFDPEYLDIARGRARQAVAAIGLDVASSRAAAQSRTSFAAATGKPEANPQQHLIDTAGMDEPLLILEAETGSGKTEAAFWRFAKLFEAGRVDGLYFAVPTRAAAMQLHRRIDGMLQSFLAGAPLEAFLAVPGYLRAGVAEGHALPDWRVRWDDAATADEAALTARWAAENARRFLAAPVAVGTVDQAMLAGLKVKHAHFRAAALCRSLLVIDEVHASDRYMTEIQVALVGQHLKRGGHAMLMSATLGSVARARWLGLSTAPDFNTAVAAPYPAVWRRNGTERSTEVPLRQKAVAITTLPTMAPEAAAACAVTAAQAGARVLVIRNTITAAVATWHAVRAAGAAPLLLRAGGGPALHHSRFAPEDRALLDECVEAALSPHARPAGGCIVIGSQTLEQSLDIDADYLLTDLCPVDVLLQRIGRLHRHTSVERPVGFEVPGCCVLVPERGLEPLLAPQFENGLGAWRDQAGVFSGIYRDLSVLELTRVLILEHPEWLLPAMNRLLVESATHEQRIADLHAERAGGWADYRNTIIGAELAQGGAARLALLPVDAPFCTMQFPTDEAPIRTRLGEEGARITFTTPVTGPFDKPITGLTLPAHWSRGLDTIAPVVPRGDGDALVIEIGPRSFRYDRSGVARMARRGEA
ncbi:MAG: CRISPR-associated helicase/endonuclease Cas3 [Rhodospirillales bacterium 69-11]|nr:MAG: CRISPR-associated helicase/endonuclease Cas3 [Rhodospirillales bacterium 69-11]